MDACEAVEKELQRVTTKFGSVHEHANRTLDAVTKNFEDLQSTIAESKRIAFIKYISKLSMLLTSFNKNIQTH